MVKHSSLRVLRIGVLCSMLAMVALVILPWSVSAHTLAPAHSSVSPNVNGVVKIVRTKNAYNFNPHKVDISVGGSITFNNNTGRDQVVTYKNAPLVTVPAHTKLSYPVTLPAGKYVFSLQLNPKARLHVTIK